MLSLSSSTRSVVSSQLKRIVRARTTIDAAQSTSTTSPLKRALFSSSSEAPTFSSYEYPTRTEAPEITTTKASDVLSNSNSNPSTTTKVYTAEDPFDDRGRLSREERDRLKAEQSKTLGSIRLSSLPITPKVPEFIPPNVSSGELEVPETLITTLDNGIRVVSQETYSQMCTIGVLTNIGSRHESVTGTVCLWCIVEVNERNLCCATVEEPISGRCFRKAFYVWKRNSIVLPNSAALIFLVVLVAVTLVMIFFC